MEEYNHFIDRFKARKKEHKKFFQRLKKMPKGQLDQAFNQAHDEAFEKIDCLKCANCCTSISPMVTERDVDRLAKFLRMKPVQVVNDFLVKDTDGTYIMNNTPCPFLGNDNYCSVYEGRPKACREYPHTNHLKMHGLLNLAKKNASYCPAVADILTTLMNEK